MLSRYAIAFGCRGAKLLGKSRSLTGTAVARRPTMLNTLMRQLRLAGHRGTSTVRMLQESVVAHARAQLALRESDQFGRGARCYGRVYVENRGTLRIGDDFAFGGSLDTVQIATAVGGLMRIGDDVTVEYGTSISARSVVSIGNRVRVGPCCIVSDTELPLPIVLPRHRRARGVMIGDDVWIGAWVTIMPGVRIGDRAVIAAGSVVDTDLEDDALAEGTPATTFRVAPVGGRLARVRPASTDKCSMLD